MAPKSPWNKKTHKNEQPAAPAINYKEVQDEEIEVLRAIFMDDYEEVETKSAWSKTSDRCFKLNIKAFSDDESAVSLIVTLTATYPRTAPLLSVAGVERYHERTRKRIRNVIQTKPPQFLGEVMVHAIATDIQEALEDAVQARQNGTLPSLEDERVNHEEQATNLAKEAEEQEARRIREAAEEEDRVLSAMINEEISRREKRKPVRAPIESGDLEIKATDVIEFDQPVAEPNFRSVALLSSIGTNLTLVQPRILSGNPLVQPMVARRVLLKANSSKSSLVDLESELEKLKALRQPNLAVLYTFKIDRVDMSTQLVIVTEFASKGSLNDLLDLFGTPLLDKGRQWSIQLLEALDYLHLHGLAHKDIHSHNILICAPFSGGESVPKLADCGYQYRLHQIQNSVARTQNGWSPPELAEPGADKSRKTDVWELGVVFLQILFGSNVVKVHSSPSDLLGKADVSDQLDDVIRKWFQLDPRRRPSAFDLLPSEFLRTGAPITENATLRTPRRPSASTSSMGGKGPHQRRSRHNSQNGIESISRYANDFAELGRLGKGGFGEVVKARNKLDGGVYAIKKVKQDSAAQLEQVLSEVMLLNRLNHPYVVRYFSTWVEDDVSGLVQLDEKTVSTTEEPTESSDDCPRMDFGAPSTSGLDFVSSSGYPQIEFGEDDEEDDGSSGSDSDSETDLAVNGSIDTISTNRKGGSISLGLRKTRSDSRRVIRSTLYIQMEYCERHTLRDLIRKDLHAKPDEGWRLLRQITEGLAHIHSHGIIHRDLKPDNVFIDVAGNPRIGDFGLATTSQYHFAERATMSGNTGGDMTRSVGTALYVAPELRSTAGGSYSNKVDMYSLGIIFFEMTWPLKTAMERDREIRQLREKEHDLPAGFETPDKTVQGSVILSLITHKPSERPSSNELLRSEKIPLKIEDETIRQALASLSDTGSPYHQKMMSALFSSGTGQRVKDYAWELKNDHANATDGQVRCRAIAQSALQSIFRRHGAEEADRPTVFPRSTYYTMLNVFQLLDQSGNLLQLPYDLTLPYARVLAKVTKVRQRTFSFGSVYRDTFSGGAPRASREVDFDIVGNGDNGDLDEAEVLKVLDEIIDAIPSLASSQICFHINHGLLLDAIMQFCRIDKAQRPAVKEVLSKLNFHQWTWPKIRNELRSPALGIQTTSLDDLEQFDFRDSLERASTRLRSIFEGTSIDIETPLKRLKDVLDYAKVLNVHHKIYICPLSSFNEKFYSGSFLFQCVHDRKNRDVFAAGGRYDSLIDAHRPRGQTGPQVCAVGLSIGFDRLVATMSKYAKTLNKSGYMKRAQEPVVTEAKRCDVLVVAPSILSGLRLLTALWASDISAEMGDTIGDEHSWIVTVKHDSSPTVRVRCLIGEQVESDVAVHSLVGYLRQELRDHASKARQPALLRQASHGDVDRKSNVQVLMAQHRSKKSNKYHIVEAAQQRWSEKVDEWKDAPILAIETRDDVLESIRETRLSDGESWRRAVQNVQLSERQYLQQVQDILESMRKKWIDEDGKREACVFNFRTSNCIYYDLGT